MSFDLRIKLAIEPEELARVNSLLAYPSLSEVAVGYYGARHFEWLAETRGELEQGEKQAILATMGGVAAGTTVFRMDGRVRNISVLPEFRGLNIASGMLKGVEHLMRLEGVDLSVVDTKPNNTQMVGFLESRGYAQVDEVDLYGSGSPDLVFEKQLVD